MQQKKLVRQILAISFTLLLTACASTPYQESTGQYLDNSGVTAQVKAKLLTDKQIKSLPITVNTYKGVVQLSGFVESTAESKRAEALAKSVPGVAAVQNDLQIKTHIS